MGYRQGGSGVQAVQAKGVGYSTVQAVKARGSVIKAVQARWEWCTHTGKGGVGYRQGRSGVEAVQARGSEVEALLAWGKWGREFFS